MVYANIKIVFPPIQSPLCNCSVFIFCGGYGSRKTTNDTNCPCLAMTVLDDFIRNIVIRRPALQRWSVASGMLPALHDFMQMHHTKYKQWCNSELPKIREHLRAINKHFRTPLEKELDAVLGVIDKMFLVVGDYLYDIVVSGKPAVQWVLSDERVIQVLNTPLFGKAIDYWMRVPFMHLVEHIVDQTVLIQTHKKISNSFIHHRIKLVLKSFASSSSADELVKLLQEADVKTALFPVQKILNRVASDSWLKRDIYYEALRSLIVIPHELVLCVHNELQAQKNFDREQRLYHTRRMQQMVGGVVSTAPPAETPTTSPTPTDPPAPVASPNTKKEVDPYEKAKQELEKAEAKTAELVKWYETSAEMAKHQQHQRHADYATSFGKFRRRKLTEEQKNAKQSVNDLHAMLQEKFHVSSNNKTHPPLTVLDFTPLQVICAFVSPLHIYHTEWSGTEKFVALLHHLHTLDAVFPNTHIMFSKTDNSFCRHLKTVPVFNITATQEKCMQRSQQNRENVCGIFYTTNPQILPRDTLIQLKQCNDRDEIKRHARKNKKLFKSLKRQYSVPSRTSHKRSSQPTTPHRRRHSQSARTSRHRRRSSSHT